MEILKSEDLVIPKIMGIIYGNPGSGKTTALSKIIAVSEVEDAPPKKTLIIDIDNSTNVLRGIAGIEIIKIGLQMKTWLEVLDWLEQGGYKDYGLIGIDNLTELEHQMLTEYGRVGKNDGAPEIGQYNKTQFKIVDYVRRLRALPVDVIMTAWEDTKDTIYADGSKYTTAIPKTSGKSVDVVCGLCNLVAKIEQGKEQRYFRLEGDNSRYAKDQVFRRKYCTLENLINGGV